jgi:quercetin dioxygenase-like cupin family protein
MRFDFQNHPMKNTSLFAFAVAVALGVAPARSTFGAEPPPTDVVVIDHGQVDGAFAQGRPMMVNSSYKIQAGRRVTAPGEVEIHEHDTDIFYVTEGTATLVTGGQAEDGKTTAQGEIRGKKIIGGIERKLQKGDIVVVPAGVPHWFTEVSNPFLYLVVKVTK